MTCPICRGAGFLARDVSIDHPLFGKAMPCECKRRETEQATREYALKLWGDSDLSEIQRAWTVDNFPGDECAKAQARQAIACRREMWLFWSQTYGNGKSGLLIAIVNALIKEGLPCLYRTTPRLMDELRSGYGDDTYQERMDALISLPVLALDEFHRTFERVARDDGGSGSWVAEKLFTIIDERYSHFQDRMTLLATNRAPDRSDNHPILSRLGDSLRCHVVHVQGADLRPRARQLESYRHR